MLGTVRQTPDDGNIVLSDDLVDETNSSISERDKADDDEDASTESDYPVNATSASNLDTKGHRELGPDWKALRGPRKSRLDEDNRRPRLRVGVCRRNPQTGSGSPQAGMATALEGAIKSSVSRNGSLETTATAEALIYRGNTYERLNISGHARVHAGNVINNFHGPVTAAEAQLAVIADRELGEALEMLLLAAFKFAIAVMKTVERFCNNAQQRMSTHSLPKQIDYPSVAFEDAFGNLQRMDLRIVVDWTGFHGWIMCAFRNKPGFQRVWKAKYRLSDGSHVGGLVDPNDPPRFASVFRPGQFVQMSMHFDWSEVSDQECPRCKLRQECRNGAETICASCSFIYRGHVPGTRVEEINEHDADGTSHSDTEEDVELGAGKKMARRRKQQHLSSQDDPAKFHRISISETPLTEELRAISDAHREAAIRRHTRHTEWQAARRILQQPPEDAYGSRASSPDNWSTRGISGSTSRRRSRPESTNQIQYGDQVFNIPADSAVEIRQTEEGMQLVIGSATRRVEKSYHGTHSRTMRRIRNNSRTDGRSYGRQRRDTITEEGDYESAY